MMFKLLGTAGLYFATKAMRLSRHSRGDSSTLLREGDILGPEDRKLLENLILAGDSHAKALRIAKIFFEVTGTLSWWHHFDTYRYDVFAPSFDSELGFEADAASESTMYTLKKTIENGNLDEITSLFSDKVFPSTVKNFVRRVKRDNLSIAEIRANLPWGFLQTRIGAMSYTAARRIYLDRHTHALQEWRVFCQDMIKQVPYSHLLKLTKEK